MRVTTGSGETKEGRGSPGRGKGEVGVSGSECRSGQVEEKQDRGKLDGVVSDTCEGGLVVQPAVGASKGVRQLPRFSQAEDTMGQDLERALPAGDLMVLDIENWEPQEDKLSIDIRNQETGKAQGPKIAKKLPLMDCTNLISLQTV